MAFGPTDGSYSHPHYPAHDHPLRPPQESASAAVGVTVALDARHALVAADLSAALIPVVYRVAWRTSRL